MLNELDHWIESQWENNPHAKTHWKPVVRKEGEEDKGNGYKWMRANTCLKEMYIVRYADDFRIFCRTKTDANKTLIAVTQWLQKRLRLQVSSEKTKIVNVKRRYSEFLGFKIKVHKKAERYVVKSHINDKKLKQIQNNLKEQAINVAKPRVHHTEKQEIQLYNSMVEGIQNYYSIATNVNLDCRQLNRAVMTIFTNRLHTKNRHSRLKKQGRKLTPHEWDRYGRSAMIRYVAGSDEPIYPIGSVRHKNPIQRKRSVNQYTAEGRKGIHDNLRVNTQLMRKMMQQPLPGKTADYADNRISLFSAQWGKCAVTGKDFMTLDDIHCHHKTPKAWGGNDKYQNLVLVLPQVHVLIHASEISTICNYLEIMNLDNKQLKALNSLRKQAGNAEIIVNEKTKSFIGLAENLAS